MTKNIFNAIFAAALTMGAGATGRAQNTDLPAAIAPYFVQASAGALSPGDDGFIQRWLLLDPITNGLKTNTVFTDSYLREVFSASYFPGQTSLVVPHDGDRVKVGRGKLTWHALDSRLYNVKLFRFATSFGKPHYGVMFWAVTVIDSPRERNGVRLAVGSNGASMWWLNGREAVMLQGDRRMVKDDVVSEALTLKKGRNLLWGAVVNGPGMSDFCVRFVDAEGKAVNDITINVK